VIDRDRFFSAVREKPFAGRMTQEQVDGINAILDAWESRDDMKDKRWLAYMLATAKWETANTMQPIEEYGHGLGRPYGNEDPDTGQAYYGRGLVQLTWKRNYQRMAALTGADLINHPELALDPKIASLIMFEGMKGGLFTGVGLPTYFNTNIDAPVAARKIINGLDRANDIAAIHAQFLEAFT